MSEVLLYSRFVRTRLVPYRATSLIGKRPPIRTLQGYLVYKKTHPPRTLQQDYAYGPMAVLGGGRFLMGKLPL